jgi:murein DD-endopeptidase MepM/ murein hydrolase activator NlpD
MSKFDHIRKTIRRKKRKIHIGYVFLFISLMIMAYFIGVKFEERKRTELHQLGSIYERDTGKLKKQIRGLETKTIYIDSIPFGYPLTNYTKISSHYGYRKTPGDSTGKRSFHHGIDYLAKHNSPCIATAHGKVIFAGFEETLGNCVILEHALSYRTTFAHLSKINVKTNQNVKIGDTLGFVGNTGRSEGTHLHYEILVNGRRIDPSRYLNYISN